MNFDELGKWVNSVAGSVGEVAGTVANVLVPSSATPANKVGIGEETPPSLDQNKATPTASAKGALPSWVVPTAIGVGVVVVVVVLIAAASGKK